MLSLFLYDERCGRRHFFGELAKRGVVLNIVGDQQSATPQKGPDRLELPPHIGVGVKAVVNEEIDAADLVKDSCQAAAADTAVQMPSAAELLGHQCAYVRLSVWSERR